MGYGSRGFFMASRLGREVEGLRALWPKRFGHSRPQVEKWRV